MSNTDEHPNRFGWALLTTPLLVLGHFVALMVLVTVIGRVVAEYVRAFEELNAELSNLAIAALNFTDAFIHWWYLLLVALVVIDVPLLFFLQLLPPEKRWISHLYFNAIVFAALLTIGWLVMVVSFTLSQNQGTLS